MNNLKIVRGTPLNSFGKPLTVSELENYVKRKATRTSSPAPLIGNPNAIIQTFGRQGDDDDSEFDLKKWLIANRGALPRLLFTTICLAIASYQTYVLVDKYYGYPTGVNVLVDEPKSMREALPGVTVCHNNR